MIHALTLLAILLFASKLVSFVPMAVLAGILMVVSYNMGEWLEIRSLLKLTKTDISVWLVTFALTVFADLTVAVQAGMILAALLFISRVAATTTVSILRLRNMTALDATGLFALEEVARKLKKSGRALILCGAREQPLRLIQQTEFEELVGPENICDNVRDALDRAEEAFERLQPVGKATTAR
jgi:SulP family sulfate permease